MPLHMNSIHGFADVPNSQLVAEQPAIGFTLGKISDNAAFGMCRTEVFSGFYINGDTVPIPTSPIDGYVYSRDELIYVWGISNSTNPTTGWISGPDSLWWGAWLVDQASGAVSSVEWYRRSGGNDKAAQSNDGTLQVLTIGQRLRTSLTMASLAVYRSNDPALYAVDKPYSQTMLQNLNDDAKFGVVNSEVVYLGEFYTGQQVPQVVSPADGHTYDYAEVEFVFSWRWTPLGSTSPVTQPDKSLGQLGPMKATVDSTGHVSLSVTYVGDNSANTVKTDHGRVAVFAFCQRNGGEHLSTIPTLTNNGGTNINQSLAWKFEGANLKPGGLMMVSFQVGTDTFGEGSGLDITKCVVKKTAAGSGPGATVLQTVNVLFGGLASTFISASSSKTSDALTIAIDSTHDYWIIMYNNGANRNLKFFGSGSVVAFPSGCDPKPYSQLVGDQTAGDISGSWTGDINYWRTLSDIEIFGDPPGTSLSSASFTELDSDLFFPGQTVRASTLVTIDENARAAVLTPEFFGPTIYKDGDTVTLPVSALDGYIYSRDELTYVWDWADTTNQTGTHLRVPVFLGSIARATGAVTLIVWRLPPGGPGVDDNNTLCRINVLVIGARQNQNSGGTPPPQNPPGDVGSTLTDQEELTVNGS